MQALEALVSGRLEQYHPTTSAAEQTLFKQKRAMTDPELPALLPGRCIAAERELEPRAE